MAFKNLWVIALIWFLPLSGFASGEKSSGTANVLVDYKGIRITQEDMERYMDYRMNDEQQAKASSSQENYMQVLQNLFMIRYLASQAADYDEALVEWQTQFQRDSILAKVAQQSVIDQELASMDWEAYAREVYLAEKSKYMTEPRVDAAHILFRTEDRDAEEALELIRGVREKALSGNDFNALADEYSEGLSSTRSGGELGVFSKGQMVPEFSAAAFALKEGEISEPVKTQFGYHIIKLNKYYPAKPKPFDEVKEQIIKSSRSSMAAQIRTQIMVDARSVTGLDINKGAVQTIVNSKTQDKPAP